MPEIRTPTLIMAIQAIEAEIARLRALPEERVVPGDEVMLVDYETAAEDLEEVYETVLETAKNLPPYSHLVNRPD